MREKIILSVGGMMVAGFTWYTILFFQNCDGKVVHGIILWECVK